MRVKTFLEERNEEGNNTVSGIESRVLNSKSQTIKDDGSVLPSAKLSRRGSIKSFTSKRKVANANDEMGAVIDFMAVNKPKPGLEGSKTPQPVSSRMLEDSKSKETSEAKRINLLPGTTNSSRLEAKNKVLES